MVINIKFVFHYYFEIENYDCFN